MQGSYRPDAPPAEAMIAWRPGFGQRFIVTVDTEEEFDWTRPFARTGHGTSAVAAIPAAHARFADRGVPLIYLIDYPIATDPRAVDILVAAIGDGSSIIGAQLHPWVNPPLVEELNNYNSFSGNLDKVIEQAKLEMLTAAITDRFGARPIVYRAGRYGIGPNTLELLGALGYRIDSSMRARYDYRAAGGPDFRAIGSGAFRTGPGGALIELPLTTVFTGACRAGGAALYEWLRRLPGGRTLAARCGLLSRVALSPEGMPAADALEAVRVAVGEGAALLNFSFHSPSLVPGHTPDVRDAADLARFHRWWDVVLDQLDRLGVRPATIGEVLEAA